MEGGVFVSAAAAVVRNNIIIAVVIISYRMENVVL
jgi:hypothetical protein